MDKYGILYEKQKKIGSNTMDPDTVKLIKEFYRSERISYVLPGKSDSVSVRNENGEKKHVQIKLTLMNLNEAYEEFKETHPDVKIRFLKFSEVRPKECYLALGNRN